MPNKATERLKEIKEERNIYTKDLVDILVNKTKSSEDGEFELTISRLIGINAEERGILLGIEETKKEVDTEGLMITRDEANVAVHEAIQKIKNKIGT